jgi:hypothetical protein
VAKSRTGPGSWPDEWNRPKSGNHADLLPELIDGKVGR